MPPRQWRRGWLTARHTRTTELSCCNPVSQPLLFRVPVSAQSAPAPAQQGVTTLGSHPFPTTDLTLSPQPPAAASTPVSYSHLQRIDSKRETPWHDWSTGPWFVSHDSDDIAVQRYRRDKSRLRYRRSETYATTS